MPLIQNKNIPTSQPCYFQSGIFTELPVDKKLKQFLKQAHVATLIVLRKSKLLATPQHTLMSNLANQSWIFMKLKLKISCPHHSCVLPDESFNQLFLRNSASELIFFLQLTVTENRHKFRSYSRTPLIRHVIRIG